MTLDEDIEADEYAERFHRAYMERFDMPPIEYWQSHSRQEAVRSIRIVMLMLEDMAFMTRQ
ncbi:MAG TPA: hypothetical protein VGJ26_15105 [Pirellulales bacterium]|jgi:hypothetical protein